MAKESTFDVVSEVDKQEVANAVNQAAKELQQRYDFKDTGADIDHTENTITLTANAEERVNAALDVLQSKIIRRGISLKASTPQNLSPRVNNTKSPPPLRKASTSPPPRKSQS